MIRDTQPVVSHIYPSEGPTFGGYVVTLVGRNFVVADGVPGYNGLSDWVVRWDGLKSGTTTFRHINSTAFAVETPVKLGVTAQTTSSLSLKDGFGRLTELQDSFTFHPKWPRVSAVEPSKGDRYGGETVTVKGADFNVSAGVSNVVWFGAASATAHTSGLNELVVTLPKQAADEKKGKGES